jgi:hypothetical protein
VREHREELELDHSAKAASPGVLEVSGRNSKGAGAKSPESESENPPVNDPVLTRALDLLKGLAAVGLSGS